MSETNMNDRAERAKLASGMSNSIVGLCLFWVPIVGLIMTVVGFFRVTVRMLPNNRVRHLVCFVLALTFLAADLGALIGGAWVLTQRPEWVENGKTWMIKKLQLESVFSPPADNFAGGDPYYNEGGLPIGDENGFDGIIDDPNATDVGGQAGIVDGVVPVTRQAPLADFIAGGGAVEMPPIGEDVYEGEQLPQGEEFTGEEIQTPEAVKGGKPMQRPVIIDDGLPKG